MAIVLLNWLYIFITVFLMGEFVLSRIYRFVGTSHRVSCMGCLLTGIAVATAYAEYFSLFSGVGMTANIIMIIVCILFAVVDRKNIINMIHVNKNTWWILVSVLGIAVLCLYYTAYGSFTYDTGLYHAQTIHWIESYGVVKGLGFVHQRFAYNSAFLCLSALYSMKDVLAGTSLHAVSGLMAVICVSYSFVGLVLGILAKKRFFRPSNFLRLGAALYLIIILPEVISPSTDYTTVFFIMWLVLRWMELLEDKEKDSTPYAMLCVFAVFMISVKLSVGVMGLLVIKPAIQLIKEKKWKQIICYILLGLIAILPFFIRTVLISGWLVYPSAAVDLFNFDWKMAESTVSSDADEIKLWARLTYEGQYLNQSMAEWVPIWWERQGAVARNYTMAALIGVVLGGIHMIWETVRTIRSKEKEWFDYGFLNLVLFLGILFWMISAPSHRYGFAYLIIVPLCAIGTMFYRKRQNVAGVLPWAAAASAVLILFSISTWSYLQGDIACVRNTLNSDYLVMQRDYPRGEVEKTEKEGMEIYYPKEAGGQTWYYDFPAVNDESNLPYWKMRTGKIKDGFCPAEGTN